MYKRERIKGKKKRDLGPVFFSFATDLNSVQEELPEMSVCHVHSHHSLHTTLQPFLLWIFRITPAIVGKVYVSQRREREREGGREG